MKKHQRRIAIVGLGYVGLPLAVEFAKHRHVVGFDIDKERISEIRNGYDRTGEVLSEDIDGVGVNLQLVDIASELQGCDFIIITVPTPINERNEPDLSAISAASHTVAENLDVGDIVVYESTVYQGFVEDNYIPVFE